jgi:squalene-hopene/tetraprenyl-beta-curcumene cyclase
MNRLLLGVLALVVGLPSCVAQSTSTRTKGTIFKEEVDKLIGLIRDTARRDQVQALGGDSVLATAKVLAAMGHCHRRYHKSDGPVVKPSIDFLIENRKADGSFGDADATAWTIAALRAMDPDGFADEIATAGGAADGKPSAFDAAVSRVLADVKPDHFPQQIGAASQKSAKQWLAEPPAALDRAKAADTLVELVACQVANKMLDTQTTQEPKAAVAAPASTERPKFSAAQQKAFVWLWSQQKDGTFSIKRGDKTVVDPALTGFGLSALQTKPKADRSPDEQATIEKGLRWLIEHQNADGTFGEYLPNYTTCVVVAALARWDDPAVKGALAKAQRAILGFQNVESAGYQRGDRDYGSIGYGSSQRGDLSNLHFSIEALRATGLPANNDAFEKAIVFLQRTQNLKSVNDFSGKVPDPDKDGVILDATSGDDGGAAYYPGNSAAGYIVQPDGKSVPRSYGSMTYALLKSYTLAGVSGDDPRVQAAVKWIQENWTLAVNPGADPSMAEKTKYQGLFYYYMVLAQALDVAGVETIKAQGKEIDWRNALRAHLESIQAQDGTWVNGKNDRWMESLPLLCTCYAMTALELCR